MIEILDDLDVLARPDVDPRTLSLAGVRYGSKAGAVIDRHRIIEVGSPLVHRMVNRTGEPEYYGEDGRRFTFAELVDHAVDADGMVHFADRISYKIADGTVVGFALYGAERGHLAHFGFLRSYDEFLELFGTPDRVEENIDVGELMGYYNYYSASRKQATWDSWDERLSLVNVGAYDHQR